MADDRSRLSALRSYADFQPSTQWISDDTSETLVIRLPAGFSKENLKVQMDNLGNLRAIGERPLQAGGSLWSRFQTEHPIPQSCDIRGVRARFDNNILSIIFPKIITEEPKPTAPPAPTPKPEPEAMPEPEKKPSLPEQKQEPESKEKEEEEVKEKGERNQRDADSYEKEKSGGVAEVAPSPEKTGVRFLEGIRRPRQLVVNMFVAVIVIVVIGIYVSYKLRRGGWGRREE